MSASGSVEPLLNDNPCERGSGCRPAEALEHVIRALTANVARSGHDEVLPRNRIRCFVVGGEDQHPGTPVASSRASKARRLAWRQSEKGRRIWRHDEKGTPSLGRTGGVMVDVRQLTSGLSGGSLHRPVEHVARLTYAERSDGVRSRYSVIRSRLARTRPGRLRRVRNGRPHEPRRDRGHSAARTAEGRVPFRRGARCDGFSL